MQVTKVVLLVVLTVALGVAVLFCVTKVGDLNGQAAILQACLSQAAHTGGCPNIPISSGEIANLHDEAGTIGNLGWAAFITLWLGIGGSVIEVLKN
jgi:hypothetical protein